ncbi:vacuolar protein sorting [Salix suchowensis]|nr:vacuolar protein sorting [Salix suchowensis]
MERGNTRGTLIVDGIKHALMPLLHVVNRKVNGPRHAGDQRRHILPTVEDADVETAGDDVELATSSVLSGAGTWYWTPGWAGEAGKSFQPQRWCWRGGATSGSSASAALVDPGRALAGTRAATGSISNWIEYRATKLDTGISRLNVTDEADPYAQLLSQYTGISMKPKKLLAGWQHWNNQVWPTLKAGFDEQFEASGLPLGKRASERNAYVIAKFHELPPSEQERQTQEAIALHEAAKQAVGIV